MGSLCHCPGGHRPKNIHLPLDLPPARRCRLSSAGGSLGSNSFACSRPRRGAGTAGKFLNAGTQNQSRRNLMEISSVLWTSLRFPPYNGTIPVYKGERIMETAQLDPQETLPQTDAGPVLAPPRQKKKCRETAILNRLRRLLRITRHWMPCWQHSLS